MARSRVSEKKPRKLTLSKKPANKENAKKKISKPDTNLKRPKVSPAKERKNREVIKIVSDVAKGKSEKKKKIASDKIEIKQAKVVKTKSVESHDVVKDVSKKQLKANLKLNKSKITKRVTEEKEITNNKVKKNLKRKHATDKVAIKVEVPKLKKGKTEESVISKPNLKRKQSEQKTINEQSERTVKKEGSKKQSAPAIKLPIKEKKKQSKELKRKVRKAADSVEEKISIQESSPQTLSKEHILECIAAVFHLTEEQLKDNKNSLFAEDVQPIFMQVTCLRIPKTPQRQMRILLPHSLVSANDEVALIVGDLQKGRRKDYEPTVDHYKSLLEQHGCTSVKDVIPMNRIKTEYDQFELKRKLVGSYDYFLVDGKVSGHVTHLLGKIFYGKRKVPIPIRMNSKDLNHEINHALQKTSMEIHSHGNTHIMQVGSTHMTREQIFENILAACENLEKNYPGGWANISSLRIKGATTLGIPIYITLKNKNTVQVPEVKPRRPKAYRTLEGELSTFVGDTTVTVTPEGHVQVNVPTKKNDPVEGAKKEDPDKIAKEKNSVENAKNKTTKKKSRV